MDKKISYERYARQLVLKNFGEAAQQKLFGASVLVIGAGGLGCPALQYLSAAGVGTIGIADDDVVSLSNLQRQVLYSTSDIGSNKAEKAAEIVAQLNPDIRFVVFAERLTVENAFQIMNDFDIVVDATDNFSSRYLINDACVLLKRPLVYGAVSQYEGQVAVFNCLTATGITPNYRDLFPVPPMEHEVQDCSEAGVLGVLPGIIGTMQANETIKLITGIGKPLVNRLLTYNSLNNQFYDVELSSRPDTDSLIPRDVHEFMQTDYNWLCASALGSCEIDHDFFDRLLEAGDVEVIDVRKPGEDPPIDEFPHYRIPLDRVDESVAVIRSSTVVTVCQSGSRSYQAARKLAALFGTPKTVYSLRGGIISWKQHHSKELS